MAFLIEISTPAGNYKLCTNRLGSQPAPRSIPQTIASCITSIPPPPADWLMRLPSHHDST